MESHIGKEDMIVHKWAKALKMDDEDKEEATCAMEDKKGAGIAAGSDASDDTDVQGESTPTDDDADDKANGECAKCAECGEA